MFATTIRIGSNIVVQRNSSRTGLRAFPGGLFLNHRCHTNNRHYWRSKLLFSSSSSSNKQKQQPRLSHRNKRDLFILAVGACGAFGYHLTCSDWDEDVWIAKDKLMSSISANTSSSNKNSINSLDNLPPPVGRYIEKVLLSPSSLSLSPFLTRIRSPSLVTAHQSGEFYAARQWYPFDATLLATASTTNPGFVWDARMTILNLSNRVLEYYITTNNKNKNKNKNNNNNNNNSSGGKGDEGNIITKVWGKYPLIQIEEEDPYILFWLAMTPMFPIVFLQQQGRAGALNWINSNSRLSHDNLRTCATAQLVTVGDGTFLVEYFFREEDDLLFRIKVTSSSCLDGDGEPWQAFYDDYKHLVSDFESEDGDGQQQRQRQQQQRRPLLVPSKIEIGKGEGDQYRPHFKINNHHVEYR